MINLLGSLSKIDRGKIAEFQVISELIAMGLDLYVPVIDIGIDAILRMERHGEPTRYYDLQIKSSVRNVSIRGARKIIHYINEREPRNYYLLVAIREKAEIKHIFYLTPEQIIKFQKLFKNTEEIDIYIPAKDRDRLISYQSLDDLVAKLKSK